MNKQKKIYQMNQNNGKFKGKNIANRIKKYKIKKSKEQRNC